MMHFNSFFSLSLLTFLVLDPCRLTAAATLAVSPVKRGRLYDSIECPSPLPDFIPSHFPVYSNLSHMCANRLGHRRNLECACANGEILKCGMSTQPIVRKMITYCLDHCLCGPDTQKMKDEYTTVVKYISKYSSDGYNPQRPPSGNDPTGSTSISNMGINTGGSTGGSTGSGDTCSGTCTGVDRGCNRASNGGCACFAPPIGLFFWFDGYCGTRLPFKARRDLAQQRYLNATAEFASSDHATDPPGPPPDLAAQLASGMLPSPCNSSYVSFACGDSKDGIVHEPPQNWLGALLPEGAAKNFNTLPPAPEEWLRIHRREERKRSVDGE